MSRMNTKVEHHYNVQGININNLYNLYKLLSFFLFFSLPPSLLLPSFCLSVFLHF